MGRFLILFGGIGIWALWFVAAYSLHGAQCADALGWERSGQGAQIALWLGAITLTLWTVRKARKSPPDSRMTAKAAQWLGTIALVAVLFTGAAALFIAPC